MCKRNTWECCWSKVTVNVFSCVNNDLCLPVQWGFHVTRATPPCATGKILCWTLTASPPSTLRLVDPTITITTTTIPRAFVRTSSRAWCELSRRHGEAADPSHHTSTKICLVVFLSLLVFLFGGLIRGCSVVFSLPFASPTQPKKHIWLELWKLCNEGNEWRNTRGLKTRNHFANMNPDKRFLLQKKCQKHDV